MKRLLGLAADLTRANLGRSLPFRLTYIVTDECSCRCAICNLWQQPRKGADLAEIERLFRANPQLSWINLSGGEVVERADFADIVAAAVRHTRVYVIDFPTAGQRPEMVEAGVRAALATSLPRLFVSISLDGPREVHDRLRGTPGAFDRAIDTLQRLRGIADRRLKVYAGLTLSSRNDADPEQLVARLLAEAPLLTRADLHFNLAHFAPHYYRNRPQDAPHAERVAAFLAAEHGKRRQALSWWRRRTDAFSALESAYWRLVPEYLTSGDSPIGCAALGATAFVAPDLRLYPCATWDRPLADLRDCGYSLAVAVARADAVAAREEARRHACPGCWTPCEAYPAMLTAVAPTVLALTRPRRHPVAPATGEQSAEGCP